MTFVLTLKVPDGVMQARIVSYVRDAVSCWNGQFQPPGAYGDGDPLFGAFRERGELRLTSIAQAVKRYLATVDEDVDEWYITKRNIHRVGAEGLAAWEQSR